MEATLTIIILRGDPDRADTRHTALFIQPQEGSNLMVHIVGEAPFFRKDMKENTQPTTSRRFLGEVPVAKITGKTTSQIGGALFGTPIRSGGGGGGGIWNCQDWVCDALEVLRGKDWITASARSSAITGMWNVVQGR